MSFLQNAFTLSLKTILQSPLRPLCPLQCRKSESWAPPGPWAVPSALWVSAQVTLSHPDRYTASWSSSWKTTENILPRCGDLETTRLSIHNKDCEFLSENLKTPSHGKCLFLITLCRDLRLICSPGVVGRGQNLTVISKSCANDLRTFFFTL